MILSLAAILLCGLLARVVFTKIELPPSVGMILIGIVIGPSVLNLVESSYTQASFEFRHIALAVIFTRAGLNVSLKDFSKNGISAFLMCFMPAVIEILGAALAARLILGYSWLDGCILGSVLAGISPAVTIPNLEFIKEKNYGLKKRIPHMMLAAASFNAAIVLIIFGFFSAFKQDPTISLSVNFSTAIMAVGFGLLVGWLLSRLLILLFRVITQPINQAICFLGFSFLMIALESNLVSSFGFSSMLASIFCGMLLCTHNRKNAQALAKSYADLWALAEIFLFVLAGVSLNISLVIPLIIPALIIFVIVLAFRTGGVWLSLLPSKLNLKEKIFCMECFVPKAAVQAATAAIPLYMGMEEGQEILTIAVMAIIITAPLGAILIRQSYRKLLSLDGEEA